MINPGVRSEARAGALVLAHRIGQVQFKYYRTIKGHDLYTLNDCIWVIPCQINTVHNLISTYWHDNCKRY
jgi:hypothetical protein